MGKLITARDIAKICHEVNSAYVGFVEGKRPPMWHDLSPELQDSGIAGVEAAADFGVTPEKQHEEWVADKLAHGWTYGEVKDEEKKTHPCLVPYDQLPDTQKVKDHLFVAVVHAMMMYLNTDLGPCDCQG